MRQHMNLLRCFQSELAVAYRAGVILLVVVRRQVIPQVVLRLADFAAVLAGVLRLMKLHVRIQTFLTGQALLADSTREALVVFLVLLDLMIEQGAFVGIDLAASVAGAGPTLMPLSYVHPQNPVYLELLVAELAGKFEDVRVLVGHVVSESDLGVGLVIALVAGIRLLGVAVDEILVSI